MWLFIIAGVSLGLFVLIELLVHDPLVDLRLYRRSTYSMATVVGVLLGFGMFGSSLLLPLFLEDFLEYTACRPPSSCCQGGADRWLSPLAGKLCDQFNPRFLLVLGLLLTAVSTYWFAWMDVRHRGAHAGLGADRARRARVGLPAPGHVGLRTLAPEAISAASGLLNITRQTAWVVLRWPEYSSNAGTMCTTSRVLSISPP